MTGRLIRLLVITNHVSVLMIIPNVLQGTERDRAANHLREFSEYVLNRLMILPIPQMSPAHPLPR